MPKYAICLTDTHLVPGSHALMSSLQYYGAAEDVAIHYLFWPGTEAAAAVADGLFDFYPNFIPEPLVPDLLPLEYAPLWDDRPNCCYHSRWARAGMLQGYDAVSVFDADILLVQDPRPWFRVAAQTGLLVLPDNDYSGYQADGYDLAGIQGDASPAWHNQPSFWRNDTWGAFMRDLPLVGLAEHRSDIVALSRMLIERGLTDEVLTTWNGQFLQTHYYNLRLCKREVGGKRYLALHANGDRLVSVHRRWWIPWECTRFVTDITDPADRERGLNNIRLFHDFYTFFNLQCEHRL